MIFSSLQFLLFWVLAIIISRFEISKKPIIIGIIGLCFYSFQGVINFSILFYVFLIVCLSNRLKNNIYFLSFLILLPLIFIKYSKFIIQDILRLNFQIDFLDNLIIPPGLSFISFSAIALVVYLKNNKEKFDVSLSYLYLFPQLIAGPIVQPKNLIPQIKFLTIPNLKDIYLGVFIFSIGILIKVFLADSFGRYIDPIFRDLNDYSFDQRLTALLLFSQQIFLDFNGYTLMAIGVGKTIGINLPENFNTPYLSTSISDFWRKWHITLSNWIRDYIYIPLGGSKNGILKHYYNIFFAMLISGLWHGAGFNFLIWGSCHAIFIILEKIFYKKEFFLKIPKYLKIIYSYLAVSFLWIFFRVENYSDLSIFFEGFSILEIKNINLLYLIIILFFLNYLQKYLTINFLSNFFYKMNKNLVLIISMIIIFFCILISKGSSQKFIYFNF